MSTQCDSSHATFLPRPTFAGQNTAYHLLALLTVGIWGITFVSTKLLIGQGLSPTEIFLLRFAIAYVCLLTVSHGKWRADSLRDEALMLVAGLSGGSIYFITENTALGITFASNVSLLICTAPLFTMLFGHMFCGLPVRRGMLAGSVLALCGVGLVVFNGAVSWGINPLGDLLTVVAAMLWATYCLVLKSVGSRYQSLFVTRKVFFYGVMSALMIYPFTSPDFDPTILLRPIVYGNLIFLGVGASMMCYLMWSMVVKKLGAEKTANYIYCIPLVTIISSVIFLDEPVTLITLLGTAFIIGGVYLAER